jgi:hypothetical protein
MAFTPEQKRDYKRTEKGRLSTAKYRASRGTQRFVNMMPGRGTWEVDGRIHWMIPHSWLGGSPHIRSVHLRKNFKTRDRSKGFDVKLIIPTNEITDIIKTPCYSCGLSDKSRGLDRIDNSRGYERGNVLPCCEDCNVSRSDHFSVEEMVKFIGPAIRAARLERGITI